MTKGDIIRLSKALRAVRPLAPSYNRDASIQHARDCKVVADFIASKKPDFDDAVFLDDCGVFPP
jgi:hypothetical protein